MNPIRTLFQQEENHVSSLLPPDLASQYGGDLSFPHADRLYISANFVSTLDGVVTFALPGQSGGGEISGGNEADRFIMGLLRASADAIVVGAETLNETAPTHRWTGASVYPAAAEAYAHYRKEVLGKPRDPLTVIVTGRGHLDLTRSLFHSGAEVLIVTSALGKDQLLRNGADQLPSTQIRQLAAVDGSIDPRAIASLLENQFGVRLLLHEGGPTLLGSFVSAGILDELFLTISPQIAGRTPGHHRLGLVANVQFAPTTAPWLTLVSAKQHSSHLYLRYRNPEPQRGERWPISGA
ncbi:MAG TPA: dihydrofolate reductase family protein [Bryobacteraceae bacterium]